MNPQKNKFEKMEEFFDLRATGYDGHMAENVNDYEVFYNSIAEPILKTESPIKLLDLGCGTGLELEYIFAKAPNADVTGIDLSQEMLDQLISKYIDKSDQIEVIRGSYLDVELLSDEYDYIISVMSLHHFLPDIKLNLYKKIWRALKPGGFYIEGDYIVSKIKEVELLADYNDRLENNEFLQEELFHLDIPFSIETQQELFDRAGFTDFELIFEGDEAGVYSVKK
ncbi:methyltransferase domain-containing protein [Halanaerobiaceae bacterium Z-7014]|uniref:Methyltransferase domain-containing protein n=1 Tax=Halonatronomonas betaini TaxID=2778430 RepID=A0A931AP64_9FIRM|nr:class I SAM-dependent methyltransferase [Halonatronomonas betaini]MBF8436342.1 methyltransferase domain-containing protein [Halonatronomonas betaini]